MPQVPCKEQEQQRIEPRKDGDERKHLPWRRSELVSQPFGDKGAYLVRNRRTGDSFTLGQEEHFLLARLDGTRTADELCAAFSERFGAPLTGEELEEFFHLARERGLLQSDDTPTPVPQAEQIYLVEAAACCQRALRLKPDHASAHYELGTVLAQRGKLDEAIASFQQALRLKPDYAEAHNNLGAALAGQGKADEAATHYQQALRLKPDYAEAHSNLGIVLRQQGKADEAVAHCQQALRLKPDYAEAHSNLGIVLLEQGRTDESLTRFQEALRLKPDYAEAHNNLGAALAGQGKADEAATHYQQALRLKPDYAEAHNNLGAALAGQGKADEAAMHYQQALRLKPDYAEAHNNLGAALAGQGKADEAVAHCQQALRLKPDYAEAHNNLGAALAGQGKADEAVAHCQQALRLKPDYAEAHSNLGAALAGQGKADEAATHYQQALRLKPDYAEAHSNLGIVLLEQGRTDESLTRFQEALRLKPDYAEAHFNRSVTLLLMGHFKQGWPEYEWRSKRKGIAACPFHQPVWDGAPLAGRTILLHSEQGMGDVIQFIRYAPLVQQYGGRVVFECHEPLIRLLGRCPGIDQIVSKGSVLPEFDVHAPLLSLPGILGTSLATIPANVPYIHADEELIAHWRRELGPSRAFKVGIAWQGNPKFPTDRWRSFRLAQFEPLARLDGVRLFSLQKGPGAEQVDEVADRFAIMDLGCTLDEATGAFMDTAAIMKNLDLVVTSDTSIAHLAGALGVPVWVALPSTPDWRWLLQREDSPWYPTMRLFRQTARGDWDGVFARMAAALQERVTAPVRTKPIPIEVAPGELLDKITILEIKSARITDDTKLRHVREELSTLETARDRWLKWSEEVAVLARELRAVNEQLWEIEDEIRLCERARDFGARFIELARAVYRQNDKRSEIKRMINISLLSIFIEEKSYSP